MQEEEARTCREDVKGDLAADRVSQALIGKLLFQLFDEGASDVMLVIVGLEGVAFGDSLESRRRCQRFGRVQRRRLMLTRHSVRSVRRSIQESGVASAGMSSFAELSSNTRSCRSEIR